MTSLCNGHDRNRSISTALSYTHTLRNVGSKLVVLKPLRMGLPEIIGYDRSNFMTSLCNGCDGNRSISTALSYTHT